MRRWSAAVLVLAAAAASAGEASFAEFARRARAGERLSVVFFGASLTWGANATDQATTSYRAVIERLLEQRYPQAHLRCHDAAIGGTGSQLGVFRVERDVLRWRPDLVFLDFSANDDIASDDPETLASYEAIVRRLVEAGIPVVQVAFPFKWNLDPAKLPDCKRLAAHRAIAQAYGCGWGDAITATSAAVAAGTQQADALWDTDPVHPGDAGYALFAQSAWEGFTAAVEAQRICRAPARMLHADTYVGAKRVRLDALPALPAGWTRAKPALTGLYYDWQMSRWLDGVVVAGNRRDGRDADGKPTREPCPVASLTLRVQASAILLYGQASAASGRFRVLIDGTPVTGKDTQPKGDDRFDADRWHGNGHLAIELARGLDPAVVHRVEIAPAFADDRDQELRIESLCVAGGPATVEAAP